MSAPAWPASQNAGSSTAWCSTAETRTRQRPVSCARRPQKMPLIARLSASVPPDVKMTSLGRAPRDFASVSRASSTARRAVRPAECSDDALPVRCASATNAASAAADMGVVAAWSRYAPSGSRGGSPCAPLAVSGVRAGSGGGVLTVIKSTNAARPRSHPGV